MSEVKKSSRILSLDMMRGYFLVVIIIDHLYWYPNGFSWLSGRGDLFVSAAEGFFLISGLILGVVRGQKLRNKPFLFIAKLLVKRSVQLYITSVILMLIFTLLGWWFFIDNPGLKPGIRPPNESFIHVLIGALDYKYVYGWADFLRLYAIFIFVSPLALWLLRHKKTYIVLGLSILLYCLRPVIRAHTSLSDELLMPVTWQLIFFSGFVIGFHQKTIAAKWSEYSASLRRWIKITVFAVTLTTLIANCIIVFGAEFSATLDHLQDVLLPYFSKEALPPVRVLLFGFWFTASFWTFQYFESRIKKTVGWILIPFGTNSLYVYTIHAFVIFFVHMIMLDASSNIAINFTGTILVLAVIWLAVRTKFLMRIIPR